jgi:hypothetical protein
MEEMELIKRLLMLQIGINLRKREINGEIMGAYKQHLNNYLSGIVTRQNRKIYEELLVEANAQLKLLRLPAKFKKYENVLKQALYKEMKDILNEDPNTVYEEAIRKINSEIMGMNTFIVKDGSEPEMPTIKNNKLSLFNLPKSLDKTIEDKRSLKNKKSLLTIEDHSQQKKTNSNSKNYEDNDVVDLSTADFSNIKDEEERRKLELIQEIYISKKDQMQGNVSIIGISSAFNLNEFENKSLGELKRMDIQEMASYDAEITEDGQVKSTTLYEKDDELEKMEKEFKLHKSEEKSGYIHFSTSDTKAESTYFNELNNILNELKVKDQIRADKIVNALEKGVYLDDPVYIALLFQNDRFKTIRENFLKKYYQKGSHKNENKESDVMYKYIRGDIIKVKKKEIDDEELIKLKNTKMPLLDKYIKIPGDIFENMQKDNVFYKHDHAEGRKFAHLWKDYNREITLEEDVPFNNTLLDASNEIELDSEDNLIYNINEFIKDNTDKKIYLDLKKEAEAENKKVNQSKNPKALPEDNTKYIPGSNHRVNKKKNLKLI